MTLLPNPVRPQRMEFVSIGCGAFVVVVGTCVLAGWQFGVPVLKSVLPGVVSMKANTALAFLLAGIALMLLWRSPLSSRRARAGRLLALLVAVIGAATLLEYVLGWNLGIDELFFKDDPAAVATGSSGRMAPTTALNFLLLGLSLLLIEYEPRKGFRPAEAFVLLPLLVSVTSLVGYVHGGQLFFALPQFTRMALHTAITFLGLATGVWLARPALGLLGEIRAGLVHRRERRVYLAFVLSLVVLIAIGTVAIHNANVSVERSRWVDHTLQVRTELVGLLSAVQEVESGARGYLLTGDDEYPQPYQEGVDEVESRYQTLQSLIADNAVQAARLRQLEPLLRARVNLSQRMVEARRAQGFDAALALLKSGEGKHLMDSIRAIVEQMDVEEARLLAVRIQDEQASVTRMNLTILLGSGLALAVVLFAVIALRRDLVLRWKAEEALRENEARYRNVYDTVPVSIWEEDWSEVIAAVRGLRAQGVTDWGRYFAEHPEFVTTALKQVKVLDVNQETLTLFGAEDKEQMLASLETVFATPDTLPGFVGELAALGEGQRVYRTEMALRTVGGGLITVLLTMTFPAKEDKSGLVLVSLMDITERKRAEEERDRFFTLSRDMICIAGFDGCFKRLNPAWEKTLGFTAEELLAVPYLEFVHSEDREATAAEAAKLATGLETISFENRYRCKDGSYKWLLWSATPSVDHELIYAVAHDISDRKRTEEEIRSLNENLKQRASELEAANKELEAFTYSVSHDLRAPLRHIDGFARILLEEHAAQLSDDGRRCLDRVCSGARQMGQLVDDLLGLSRIGRRELQLQVTGLNSLVEEVKAELLEGKEDQKVEWRVRQLPFVECDPALMKQVFANLLSNAVKYTRPRPQAVIEVGQTEQDDRPVVYVRDNGVGFSMKYADRLFGVFQRLHRPEDFEGTGVGLATVHRIIQKHGGQVWAEAQLDKGATFYFTLGTQGGTSAESMPS